MMLGAATTGTPPTTPNGPFGGTTSTPMGRRGPGGATPGQSWDDIMPGFGLGTDREAAEAQPAFLGVLAMGQ